MPQDILIKYQINSSKIKHIINVIPQEDIAQMRKNNLIKEGFDISHLTTDSKNTVLDLLLSRTQAFSKNYTTLGQLASPGFKLLHDYPIQCKPHKTPSNIAPQLAERFCVQNR